MNLLTTLGVGVLAAVSALVLKECKSPLAPLFTLSAGLVLLLSLIPRETVGKVLAAGLLTSIGTDVCCELGAPSLGAKLELAGKIEILLLSLPLFGELFSRVEVLLS